MDPKLEALLREAVAKEASDIHLKVGVPPYIRVHGSLLPYGDERYTKDEMDRLVSSLLEGDALAKSKDRTEIDIAQTIPGVARFRTNIFRQRGSFEIVMRVVPYNIPTMEALSLPTVLKHVAMETRGLVLVTGITGSGKSSTVAAMLNHINENLAVHIVTIEDPIEFVYRDVKASISQREVGIDTETFANALKYVLRQDPDVIVLGEMRDRETAQTAITAAETGHLVFSTLHTADAVQTIDRLVDLFPPEQQDQLRHSLAATLKAVISMRLLARTDGKGRVPAMEIMINTPAIRSLIEENKLGEIKGLIAEGAAQYGMQTFDQSLLNLFNGKQITKESALEEASSAAELELAMRGITTGTGSANAFMRGGQDDFYREKSKEFFNRARRLFEQGLLEDASREVRRALVDNPEYAEAKELLGKIEDGLSRDVAKGKTEPFVKRGLEFVMKDRTDEAIAVFKQGLDVDPQNEKLLSLIKAAEEKGQKLKGIRPLMEQAQSLFAEAKFAEARQVLGQVLERDAGHAAAYEKLGELMAVQARQQVAQELEALAAKAEEAFGARRMFDAIAQWNLVREIQADHPKAAPRITEAAAQLRSVGVPGLPAAAQAAWVPVIQQAFEKGLTSFMAGQAPACLSEWRAASARVPQSGSVLEAFTRRVEELHAFHIKYHVDRAKALWEQGELGRAMTQLRHVIAVDPAAPEARGAFEAHKSAAEQTVQRYLQDAAEWERRENLAAAVFCLERAHEIDPTRDGLKQKMADVRARHAKMKELASAMDRRIA